MATSHAPSAPAVPPGRGGGGDTGSDVPRRVGPLIFALALAGVAVSLLQSLIIPIVGELPSLVHASASDAAWAVTATLLAASVATPVVGRLGDMYGKRKMLLISVAAMVVGSVIGAFGDSLTPLIIARALQGLSVGVIPLGLSIMRDELPPARLGSAAALMSASLGVGGALGLPFAALIADRLDWHWLFWSAAILGVMVIILVAMLVPESAQRSGGRFDLAGAAGISGGLLALLLGVSKGSDWGWTSPTTLSLLIVAVVVLLAWGYWELRSTAPLVNLRTAGSRQVLLTNAASLLFGFAMFAMSLVLSQLLQLPTSTGYGLGQSVLITGLVMAPAGLTMMAVSPLSARITAAAGAKVTLILGSLVVAGGYLLGLVLLSAVWQIIVITMVISTGIGFAYGALPTLIMSSVPRSETASANSFNSLMRALGTSFSSALCGVVLAQMTTPLGGTTIPSEAGFQVVFVVAAAAALTAAAFAAFLPRRPQSDPTTEPGNPSNSTALNPPAALAPHRATATSPATAPATATATAPAPAPATAPAPAPATASAPALAPATASVAAPAGSGQGGGLA